MRPFGQRLVEAIAERGRLCVGIDPHPQLLDAWGARAYLGDGSPLAADAITASPYLGFGSLQPALELAHSSGRGVFVVARTFNLEGAAVQQARVEESGTVAQLMIDAAAARNASAEGLGSVGVVVGATREHGLELRALNGPVLAPGLGAQGATAHDLANIFSAARDLLLPSTSRSLLEYGPQVSTLREAALRVRNEVSHALS